jgi:ATP-binding cassette subfamily B protein
MMAVTAPITAAVGTVMAVREDAGLSVVLLVAIPVLVAVVGVLMTMARPVFTAMQDRIDDMNTVLREQIPGLRVVRAFAREPGELARFGTANAELTATALRSGRILAVLFQGERTGTGSG